MLPPFLWEGIMSPRYLLIAIWTCPLTHLLCLSAHNILRLFLQFRGDKISAPGPTYHFLSITTLLYGRTRTFSNAEMIKGLYV